MGIGESREPHGGPASYFEAYTPPRKSNGEASAPLGRMDGMLKAAGNTLTNARRDIEREMETLQDREDAGTREIKTLAEKGDHAGALLMARSLQQTKRQMFRLRTNLDRMQLLSDQMTGLRTTAAVASFAKRLVGALQMVNSAVDLENIKDLSQALSMEMQKFELAEETMNETVDDLMNTGEEEMLDSGVPSAEEILTQIYDAANLRIQDALPSAGTRTAQTSPLSQSTAPMEPARLAVPAGDVLQSEPAAAPDIDADLQRRLDNLKKRS